MPKVTVIMPSLNVGKYIRQCMESVVNQTLADIEILAIDAGSQDGTLEILREYERADNRIRVILSEKKSYGYQINRGVCEAQGEYIAIVETDDRIAQDMLEVLYQPAKDNALDYVKGDFAFWFELENNLSWIRNMRVYPIYAEMYDRIIKPSDDMDVFLRDIYLWRGIYRRQFLVDKNIFLNETNGAAFQDQGFLFQTIKEAESAMYIRNIVYYYRQSNEGSSIYNPKAYDYLLGEYPYVKECLRKKGQFDRTLECAYYTRLFQQITGRYRTMAAFGKLWEGTQLQRQQLHQWVKEGYRSGAYDPYVMGKAVSMELFQYLTGEDEYWQYQLNHYQMKRNVMNELLDRVREADSVVFYSRSMVGGFVYALIKVAGIDKKVCFCDNNEKYHGTEYMNTHVYSIKDAVAMNPDGLYIIANRRFDSGMREQLLDLGVSCSKIYTWLLDIDILLLNMAYCP